MTGQSIKNEVRILGLDPCNRHRVIGVIVRGGLYLDGVLNLSNDLDDTELGRSIRESRYYPELRFIMIHQQSREKLDTEQISRMTRLPIVEIRSTRPSGKTGSYARMTKDGNTIYARTKLDPMTTSRLIGLSWTMGGLPEPVRVAHLLAKSINPRDHPGR